MKLWRISVLLSLLFIFAVNATSAERQKIIFDCDLGGDIDDAFALALVIASPEFEVLGIVLDYGNTPKRAEIACRMLYETGMDDIPVYVGRKTNEHFSSQFHWADGFDKLKPQHESGADFIVRTLRKFPDEIIVFTVGPVPNMQDILAKDPSILTKAKHVYSMFGSFYMGYGNHPVPSAEWNVRADVRASKIFSACGATITYAGLDITTFVKLDKERRERLWLYDSPLTNALKSLYTLWRYQSYSHPDPTLFDVVAVGMVLWPELFETRPTFVKVIDGGYTVIDESKDPNSFVGMSVNKEELLKRMMDRLLKQHFER